MIEIVRGDNVKQPTTVDLAWAAGFLEGEGSFRFTSKHRTRPGCGSPCVNASQVQREPLNRLQEIFGGQIKLFNKNGYYKNRSINVWLSYGARAVGIMQTLYDFMSPYRRQQIRLAIAQWRVAPGQLSLRPACKRGHLWTPENTYRAPKAGTRACVTCNAMRTREYVARRKARASAAV